MHASDARKIAQNFLDHNAILFWQEIKESLFKSIKVIAQAGGFCLIISKRNDICKQIIENEAIRELVSKKLKELGYRVGYYTNVEEFVINWETEREIIGGHL